MSSTDQPSPDSLLKIGRSPRIVVLTGAGISRESGLSTFRDPDGIWAQYDIEDVATPRAFLKDPLLVQQFYNARRQQLRDPAIAPNAAHLALANLEAHGHGEVLVVTQNVDNLHERAGSRNLIHMHGELCKVRCTTSGNVFPRTGDIAKGEACPCCGTAGTLRPDVVWFGELPRCMDEIGRALSRCNFFVAIGTSGNVYPAAGFVEDAKRHGKARTVEMNLESTGLSPLFDQKIIGPASKTVPALVHELSRLWAE
jgi:NAD-dependent deacetylase